MTERSWKLAWKTSDRLYCELLRLARLDLSKNILSNGIDLRFNIQDALERAAWHGHISTIEHLLKYVEINDQKETERLTTFESTCSEKSTYWPDGNPPESTYSDATWLNLNTWKEICQLEDPKVTLCNDRLKVSAC